MRNVVLYELLSLDGVAEEPGDWLFDGGEAIFDNLGRIIRDQDTVLLGRGTYEYWVDYWPTSDVEPFASFINGTQKFVYASTRPAGDWSNTTMISTSAVEHVTSLKQESGGDIGIHGSIELAQSLLRAGLVDDLHLVIAPTVAGAGRRLFDGADLQKLDLVALDRSPAGSTFAHYRMATDDRG